MVEKIKVWYLGHSGFAIELDDTILIFDYYLDVPESSPFSSSDGSSLDKGIFDPIEFVNKQILVFSSHRHADHFNPIILTWREVIPNIEYFLSSCIDKKYHRQETHILSANEFYESDNLTIRTFKSTDEGLAFLLSINGVSIYHAGDLNWWHWEGEPESWNNNMAELFKREVALIANHPIDIAFLTTDSRQESAELWGISYFLEKVDVSYAFPMHFWEDFSIMNRIDAETAKNPEYKKIQGISRRGQSFDIIVGGE